MSHESDQDDDHDDRPRRKRSWDEKNDPPQPEPRRDRDDADADHPRARRPRDGDDDYDDRPRPRRRRRDRDDEYDDDDYPRRGRPERQRELEFLVPINQSGWAIASGYLGLISVLCVPGPFALLTGILALRDIKRHPDKGGKIRAIFGIVMGVLGTLVLAFSLIGFLSDPRAAKRMFG